MGGDDDREDPTLVARADAAHGREPRTFFLTCPRLDVLSRCRAQLPDQSGLRVHRGSTGPVAGAPFQGDARSAPADVRRAWAVPLAAPRHLPAFLPGRAHGPPGCHAPGPVRDRSASSRSRVHRLEAVCICGHTTRDETPVASASLAQVHQAMYQGPPVDVKLLKPDVLDRLNADLALLWRFRGAIGGLVGIEGNLPAHELIAEFRQRLLDEVDLQNEALNIETFRESEPDTGPVRAPGRAPGIRSYEPPRHGLRRGSAAAPMDGHA